MRLFKFLVISNDTIQMAEKENKIKYFDNLRDNTFYLFNDILLMSIPYPNECYDFVKENEAYIVLDKDIYEIVSGIYSVQNNIIGTTWSFYKDTKGTRYTFKDIQKFENNLLKFERERTIEPRTGGMPYSALKWSKGKRPKNLKGSIYVSMHYWIKKYEKIYNDASVELDKSNIDKINSYYHIGHTFDNRNEFIGIATKEEQKNIIKNIEPKNHIYRGKRVLGGQNYYSKDLNCTCSVENGNKEKCRECQGVLYIDEMKKLTELYEQLTSDEYKSLKQIHNIK